MCNEKQQRIVEMAKDICRHQPCCNDVCKPISACDALRYAERAIEAGYSKQSEGEWLVSEFPFTASKKVKCSECGYIEHRGPAWNICWGMHKYCPNCGAKMKGGE